MSGYNDSTDFCYVCGERNCDWHHYARYIPTVTSMPLHNAQCRHCLADLRTDDHRKGCWTTRPMRNFSHKTDDPSSVYYEPMNVTKESNPKDRAATDRLDFSVWPETASAYGALAMTEGDYKYGAYNYRVAGVRSSVYVAALRRHMAKWYNGENEDPDTTVPHLANAIACIGVLIDALEAGALIDDRPPKIDMGGTLERLRTKVKHLQSIFPPDKGPGRYTEIEHGNQKKSDT